MTEHERIRIAIRAVGVLFIASALPGFIGSALALGIRPAPISSPQQPFVVSSTTMEFQALIHASIKIIIGFVMLYRGRWVLKNVLRVDSTTEGQQK